MTLPLKIKLIHETIRKRANSELQALDLTLAQHHTILYLSHQPEQTAELKALEREFCVAQATMAGIAQRLEAKEYVRSFPHPGDKRIKLIQLTPKGRELAEQSRQKMRSRTEQMLSGLSGEEMEELNRLLDTVYQNLQEEP